MKAVAEAERLNLRVEMERRGANVRPDGTYAANAQAKRWKKRDEA